MAARSGALAWVLAQLPTAQCVEWPGYRTRAGYGWLGRLGLAHRVVYERVVGRIRAGLTLDHLCRNRACVNPCHLEPVTFLVNIRRGIAARLRLKVAA